MVINLKKSTESYYSPVDMKSWFGFARAWRCDKIGEFNYKKIEFFTAIIEVMNYFKLILYLE
jgi:hypothetical protein